MKSRLQTFSVMIAFSIGVLAASCEGRDYDAEWITWCPHPGFGDPDLRTCGEICEQVGSSCGLAEECDGVAYALTESQCESSDKADSPSFDVGCDGQLPEGYAGYYCCCSLWDNVH